MAIALAYIDFLVPIATIKTKYAGGWEKFVYDNRRSIGGVFYFDEHLAHKGAMSPDGIQALIDRFSTLGFEATDYCVVESLLSGKSPCDWLVINDDRTAHLVGADPCPVVGLRLFYERRKTKEAELKFKKDCRRMRWAAILMYRFRSFRAVSNWLNTWLIRQQCWESPQPHFSESITSITL